MRAFLIRHAQTEWNVVGRAQGHTDHQLDSTGVLQAKQLARRFHGHRIEKIFTSDLQRCVQTAEPLSLVTGCPMEKRADLRERCFGEWEGLEFTELRRRLEIIEQNPEIDAEHFAPNGGESLYQIWERLGGMTQWLQSATESIVAIVTHGGAKGLMLSRLIRGNPATGRSFRFGNTSVTELLRRPDGTWQLERLADLSHLELPSVPMIDANQTAPS